MKRKIFTALFIFALALLTLNASRSNDEIKRMGLLTVTKNLDNVR